MTNRLERYHHQMGRSVAAGCKTLHEFYIWRNKEIIWRLHRGESSREIAKDYGLSPTMVSVLKVREKAYGTGTGYPAYGTRASYRNE
jgi:hypothetical protein